MTEPTSIPLDENQIIAERRAKLARLREAGNPFPNDFVPADRAARLSALHADMSREQLEAAAVKVSVSGRMVATSRTTLPQNTSLSLFLRALTSNTPTNSLAYPCMSGKTAPRRDDDGHMGDRYPARTSVANAASPHTAYTRTSGFCRARLMHPSTSTRSDPIRPSSCGLPHALRADSDTGYRSANLEDGFK